MNEYGISDYSIFENAKGTSNAFMAEIEAFISTCNECKTTLADTEVLEGPVADDLQKMFIEITNDMKEIQDKCIIVNNFIEKIYSSYTSGDKEAMQKIMSVNDKTIETK